MRQSLCFLLAFLVLATASAANSTSASTSPATEYHKITNENIHHAVKSWVQDQDETLSLFGPIDQWDTSRVTDMTRLFSPERDQSLINFNANITHWDISAVTSLKNTFYGNAVINLDLGRWNVSSVKDMSGAFALTQVYEGHGLQNWASATSQVVNASHMFRQSLAFNSHHVHLWDLRSLRDASKMFQGATSFRGGAHRWTWTTHGTHLEDMTEMFSHAEMFNGDLTDLDVSKVTNLRGAFFKASKFNNGDENEKHDDAEPSSLSKWNTHRVTDMNSVFAYAEKFQGIGVDNWNVEKVTNFANAFKNTSFDQNVNAWSVSSGLDFRNAFRYTPLGTSGSEDKKNNQLVCWQDMNQEATVEGIFFQSHAHFDKSCVKHKFIVASCCRPDLDSACECDTTTVNQDHEGNNSSVTHGNSVMDLDQKQEKPMSNSRSGPKRFLMAVFVAAVCLTVVLMSIMVRRRRRGRRSLMSLGTSTIHIQGDGDWDASDLDMTMTPYPTSTKNGEVDAMGGSRRSSVHDDPAFPDLLADDMEDIPVHQGGEII